MASSFGVIILDAVGTVFLAPISTVNAGIDSVIEYCSSDAKDKENARIYQLASAVFGATFFSFSWCFSRTLVVKSLDFPKCL